MEVKEILAKIRRQEKSETDFYFALEIGPDVVYSAAWTPEKEETKIFSLGEAKEWDNEENLLIAVEASLNATSQKLASEKKPRFNKVVLGLPFDWVEKDKIIPEKAKLLKKLAQGANFKPIGFVTNTEAIVYRLKMAEGIPPTAILVRIGEKKIGVALIKLGKILGVQLVQRSGELGADLTEALSRFEKQAPFPARLLLYGEAGKAESVKEEILSFSWSEEKVNFLHLPKIEILPPDLDIEAVVLAGGREISGLEEKLPLTMLEEKADGKKETVEVTGGTKSKFETEAKTEAKMEKETGMETAMNTGEKGFKDQLGFVKGADITEQTLPVEADQLKVGTATAVESISGQSDEVLGSPVTPSAALGNKRRLKINLAGFKKKFFSIFSRFRLKRRLPLLPVLGLIFLLFIGGLFFFLYWRLSKAEVVLFIKPQVLEEEFVIKLDPSLTVADKEELALPAQKVKVVEEAEKTALATGTKLIGEPAKGEVKIFKSPEPTKTFPAGTVITSISGFEFSLDEEVMIASRSGASEVPSVVAKVTALKIGAEGNLATDTEFTVANFSKADYEAKSETAFTGGSSREVQVVSAQDQEDLVDELTAELKLGALEGLKAELDSGQQLIEDSLATSVVEKIFDHKKGEEADEVNLRLKLAFSVLSFKEEDFKNLIREEIQNDIPGGFNYQEEQSEVNFILEEINKDGMAIFTARFKANLVPQIDLEEIRENLVGKRPEAARTFLQGLSHITFFDVKLSPPLPNWLKTFPKVAKNIKIEIRLD